MDEINLKVIVLISGSNSEGWISDYGIEQNWSYADGTTVTSLAIEHENVGVWLETYDELSEKIISDVEGTEFSDPDIEDVLDENGNLLEFKYTINFKGDEVIYHYVQYGEGNEAARSITVPESAIHNGFSDWVENAISNEWNVSPSD